MPSQSLYENPAVPDKNIHNLFNKLAWQALADAALTSGESQG